VRFWAAAQKLAGGLSGDFSMDPTSMAADPQHPGEPGTVQSDPKTDDTDPATPGGPSMYNGAEPFSEPVASDPEWRDPQQGPRSGGPVPYRPGPGVDTTTIHDARRASYEAKADRYGAR
jgi:hypothetical protein